MRHLDEDPIARVLSSPSLQRTCGGLYFRAAGASSPVLLDRLLFALPSLTTLQMDDGFEEYVPSIDWSRLPHLTMLTFRAHKMRLPHLAALKRLKYLCVNRGSVSTHALRRLLPPGSSVTELDLRFTHVDVRFLAEFRRRVPRAVTLEPMCFVDYQAIVPQLAAMTSITRLRVSKRLLCLPLPVVASLAGALVHLRSLCLARPTPFVPIADDLWQPPLLVFLDHLSGLREFRFTRMRHPVLLAAHWERLEVRRESCYHNRTAHQPLHWTKAENIREWNEGSADAASSATASSSSAR